MKTHEYIGFCGARVTGELSRYSDSLQAGRSGDRIPVGVGEIFHTRPDRLLGHPAGYRVFPGVKAAGA